MHSRSDQQGSRPRRIHRQSERHRRRGRRDACRRRDDTGAQAVPGRAEERQRQASHETVPGAVQHCKRGRCRRPDRGRAWQRRAGRIRRGQAGAAASARQLEEPSRPLRRTHRLGLGDRGCRRLAKNCQQMWQMCRRRAARKADPTANAVRRGRGGLLRGDAAQSSGGPRDEEPVHRHAEDEIDRRSADPRHPKLSLSRAERRQPSVLAKPAISGTPAIGLCAWWP